MADSTSPKGSSGDFAKKVQRQLSRSKEKVLQRLGKTVETRDDHFEHDLQQFNDQQTDGNRIYKDLRNYINAIRDMREASRRLSQSLFDAYETDWAGEEDLGAIVEGEDLLWNDLEVKLLDQAVHTMESYVSQFPDVREKVAKRGRKLVDYDSSLHHLEALQTAKKRDDVKINKAEEEMNAAKSVYEGINTELKEELPVLFESRVGCFVTVFSAVSNLREIFYKEMNTLNLDLQNVIKELQAQHPDKVFALKGMQRYGSLKRRTLMSPKTWKASFSDFHRSNSPRPGQRFSFRSPDKPRHSTLSRESSTLEVTPQSPLLENPTSESRDLDAGSSHSESLGSPAPEDAAAGNGLKSGEESNEVEEEEKGVKEEESEPKPPAESDNKGDGEKAPPSESSSELNNSCDDSESLELQLSAADAGPLHIEEREDSPVDTPKPNGLENGEVSGLSSKDLSIPPKRSTEEIEVNSCTRGKMWRQPH
ncbi:bridging integrator 2a isoform X1 [Sebastes umbrosus]|uniref:bridging integrator 2a isoform X1 n=1 Tax=Sebastes umbrosus TaxID=72105 RepID=UPI00189D22A9|nr:bridging integrator 2a isoform X1 [Sebastes umbrosus]XP_037629870.1 bridging integrator 2a isoform X1 [Sebastes umbrosus]XP_037629871.1 bridging integrator 2a isoform X1 [Sebastes umbrosus]